MRTTGRNSLLQRFQRFNLTEVPTEVQTKAENMFKKFTEDEVRKTSAGAASFFVWVSAGSARQFLYSISSLNWREFIQAKNSFMIVWKLIGLGIFFFQIQKVMTKPDPSPVPTDGQKRKKWIKKSYNGIQNALLLWFKINVTV